MKDNQRGLRIDRTQKYANLHLIVISVILAAKSLGLKHNYLKHQFNILKWYSRIQRKEVNQKIKIFSWLMKICQTGGAYTSVCYWNCIFKVWSKMQGVPVIHWRGRKSPSMTWKTNWFTRMTTIRSRHTSVMIPRTWKQKSQER